MSVSGLFHAVVTSAHTAITGLAGLLEPLGGLAPALAIVLFTLLVRASLTPLTYLQIRTERRRAALAPEMAKLRKKHKDPMELATATLALQREHGIGPFAGLLPALVQAPFFMVMYRVVTTGFPLGGGFAPAVSLVATALLLGWWSSRRMRVVSAETPRWLTYVPYLTVAMVAYLPLAGGLYLVTSSAWTALEHVVWRRPGPDRDR